MSASVNFVLKNAATPRCPSSPNATNSPTAASAAALIENIEVYYKNYNVYRSLVICGSDHETLTVANGLKKYHHSVYTITSSDVEYDDRENYMQRLETFNKQSVRMLIVTHDALIKIPLLIESYVLPEQNLVAFGNISDENIDTLIEWLNDAQSRGFIPRDDCRLYSAVTPIE